MEDLPTINRRQCGTLHSLCYQLLDQPEVADAKKWIDEWNGRVTGSWQLSPARSPKGEEPRGDPGEDGRREGDELRAAVDVLRARRVPEERWPSAVATFWRAWQAFKRDTGTLDFSDMIEAVLREERPAPGLPVAIFADEAQDYSQLELDLLRQWARHPDVDKLVLAGDDDQCHPVGTLILTSIGYVPIEQLDPTQHKLATHNPRRDPRRGELDYVDSFRLAVKRYKGDMLTACCGGRAVQATADHRWPVRFEDKRCEIYSSSFLECAEGFEMLAATDGEWRPATVVDRQPYDGAVWSLDVPPHHLYVADGLVTHNSIYGWRGSSVDAFLKPEIAADRKKFLRQSHRLPRAVQEYAAAWIRQVARREEKRFEPRAEGGVLRASSLSGDSLRLASEVRDRARDRDVMVLSACGYFLEPLVRQLRVLGVPFHNPYRALPRWNPLRGGGERLAAFFVPRLEGRLWTWRELWRWLDVVDCKRAGVVRGAKRAVEDLARDREQRDRRLEPDDLRSVFEYSISPPWEGRELEWISKHHLASKRKLLMFALRVAAKRGPEALVERPRIVVGSIHSVKGGQTDVTYLLPDLSPAAVADYRGEGRDGVVRTFYVGMTRSREELVLCQPTRPSRRSPEADCVRLPQP